MGSESKSFQDFRKKMNARILASGNLEIKRFFSLDKQAYKDGALSAQTKELLGLTASLVLRCKECVSYHLQQCVELGFDDGQLYEAFNVALLVGGSIVIPQLRNAAAMLDEIRRSSGG